MMNFKSKSPPHELNTNFDLQPNIKTKVIQLSTSSQHSGTSSARKTEYLRTSVDINNNHVNSGNVDLKPLKSRTIDPPIFYQTQNKFQQYVTPTHQNQIDH